MATFKQYEKKNGGKAWKFQAYLGINSLTGKPVKTTRRNFRTKKEAQLELSRLQVEFKKNNGLLKKESAITFKELYLLWLEQYRLRVKPSTVATSKRFIEDYALCHFENMEVKNISVIYCQRIVNLWHEKYKQYPYFRKAVGQVLQFGVQMEMIDSNPMRKTILPRKKEVEQFPNFYSKEELETFFNCLDHHISESGRTSTKLLAFFRLLAFTGMRKSEALALQWTDIDIFKNQLTIGKTIALDEFGEIIVQEPKTKSSQRTIKLDKETVRILDQWRTNQKKWYLERGFNTLNQEQFLFTNKFNSLYYPQAPNDWLYNILEKYNLPKITLHGFRHTHASLLFESGANFAEVKERLGHKDIKTTMNIYTHVTPEKIQETGERFANYVNF
ncbi:MULTISPECIES: site-specific integrase [unclassified Enterococcus]|uniref:site-specific integrase n=1 Tax=unclassified Enterococcus TaxID=2608891 RepID=UPI0019049E75|nr:MULTISPECIES: site-specific integrase [unclassified Enterococcus]MBK0038006.1 site-specific integrase [Enterococcus sp. S52]MBK0070681.1 site-specific integrase [Enterococcus sp. S53]MBK0141332.1 site-specific integrase [Enterococcus sp. S76]MBK0144720.1 site-specific integrase [Enterococcus sp. S77]